MNHFTNNGKEYLRKKRQYRSTQGRSPKQVEKNYKVLEITFLIGFASIVCGAITKAIGLW